MTVQVQTFRLETSQLPCIGDKRLADLGLTRLADTSPYTIARRNFKLMDTKALATWPAFLPTRYRQARREWQKFEFTPIPDRALHEIEVAKGLNCFTDLQIWTPERLARPVHEIKDPLAVGVVAEEFDTAHGGTTTEESYFLLAQWGESKVDFDELFTSTFTRVAVGISPDKLPATVVDHVCGYMRSSFVEGHGVQSLVGIKKTSSNRHCGEKTYAVTHPGNTNPYNVCQKCEYVRHYTP